MTTRTHTPVSPSGATDPDQPAPAADWERSTS